MRCIASRRIERNSATYSAGHVKEVQHALAVAPLHFSASSVVHHIAGPGGGAKCGTHLVGVGAGLGFGMLKEALHSYLAQRMSAEGVMLSPAHLLFLATRAGAEALGLGGEIGDFTPGKSADFVILRPPENSPLVSAVTRAESPEQMLAALIAQAGRRKCPRGPRARTGDCPRSFRGTMR